MTSEKNRVASPVVLVIRTLTEDGPTMLIGSVSGADSIKPLCPGKNAGLKPETAETTRDASAPALPIPGSADIALGIPPIGYAIAASGVINCNCFSSALIGNLELLKTLGITVESCNEIVPLVFVNWKTGNSISSFIKCFLNQFKYCERRYSL